MNSINWNDYSNTQQQQSTPKLLPPSVFERSTVSTTNGDISTSTAHNTPCFTGQDLNLSKLILEYDKFKYEIAKLKSENELLRIKNRDFIEQAQVWSSEIPTSSRQQHQLNSSTLEEIIHKQACEIQSLKNELSQEKNTTQTRFVDYEAQLQVNKQELLNKDKEIKRLSDIYESKVAEMQQKYDSSLTESNAKIIQLNLQLNEVRDSYEKQIQILQASIDSAKHDKETSLDEKDAKIKILNEELKKSQNELDNLRQYVNNSMPTINTCKEISREKAKVEESLSKERHKNELLNKEIEALQIRLKSLNEILTIQEAQLEPKTLSPNVKRGNLLNKWRTKVFELLVQLKSDELVYKKDKHVFNKTLDEMSDKLENAFSQNKIYENLIEDKKAELYVSMKDNTLLNEQLSVLLSEKQSLETKYEKQIQCSVDLQKFVDSLMKKYQVIEDSFMQANKKLTHLDQRIEFAKGRLDIIKALQVRKENQHKEELKRMIDLSSIHSLESNQEVKKQRHSTEKESIDSNLIQDELEKVIQERNLLANKLQSDMNLMNDKLSQMKNDYEGVIHTLNVKLKEYQVENDTKTTEIEKIRQEFCNKEILFKELHQKYNNLQSQFDQLKTQLEYDFEKQFKQKELSFIEKLAQMENKLNEARREQAKAIVLMRQMERTTNRDKERMEKLHKDTEIYYKSNLDKLQVKIIALEKERNILMNTMRQNGLSLNPSETKFIEAATMAASQQISLDTQVQVSNWLNDNSTQKQSQYEITIEPNDEKNDATSIWLDSKDNISIDQAADTSKNNEILAQIRKIMGNLELSDVEDDDVDDEINNSEQRITYDESLLQSNRQHIIDDDHDELDIQHLSN